MRPLATLSATILLIAITSGCNPSFDSDKVDACVARICSCAGNITINRENSQFTGDKYTYEASEAMPLACQTLLDSIEAVCNEHETNLVLETLDYKMMYNECGN